MLHIREAVVVEGRYDKNALSQVVDTLILETAGFGIFKDRDQMALLRRAAERRGLIVLTDQRFPQPNPGPGPFAAGSLKVAACCNGFFHPCQITPAAAEVCGNRPVEPSATAEARPEFSSCFSHCCPLSRQVTGGQRAFGQRQNLKRSIVLRRP